MLSCIWTELKIIIIIIFHVEKTNFFSPTTVCAPNWHTFIIESIYDDNYYITSAQQVFFLNSLWIESNLANNYWFVWKLKKKIFFEKKIDLQVYPGLNNHPVIHDWINQSIRIKLIDLRMKKKKLCKDRIFFISSSLSSLLLFLIFGSCKRDQKKGNVFDLNVSIDFFFVFCFVLI